jgi:hypothetical protein
MLSIEVTYRFITCDSNPNLFCTFSIRSSFRGMSIHGLSSAFPTRLKKQFRCFLFRITSLEHFDWSAFRIGTTDHPVSMLLKSVPLLCPVKLLVLPGSIEAQSFLQRWKFASLSANLGHAVAWTLSIISIVVTTRLCLYASEMALFNGYIKWQTRASTWKWDQRSEAGIISQLCLNILPRSLREKDCN